MIDNEIEMFRKEFFYADGKLFWKNTRSPHVRAGKEAGYLRKDGYIGIIVHKKSYLAHRIIFALHHGYLPFFVDHKDRDRSNNFIENLRPANMNENVHNSSTPKSNKTGVKGVRVVRGGRFEARVAANGVTVQVGTFSTLEEARLAIEEARAKLHKQFACNG